jgi:hypothetical protein
VSAEGKAAGEAAEHVIAKAVQAAGVRESIAVVKEAAESAVRDAEAAVLRDAARRGEQRAPKEILQGMEAELVGRLSSEERATIDAFHGRSAEAEEKITKRMLGIAGDRLEGEGYWLKSPDSLNRKVATDVMEDGKTVEESLSGIKDSVRYTMRFSPHEYEQGVGDAMVRMKADGFEPVGNLKNFWGNERGYMGINSVWRDRETGHLFEMQFHSEASLAAKEGTHRIYDFERLPGLDPSVRENLGRLQDGVFAQVPRPPGAASVRWPD